MIKEVKLGKNEVLQLARVMYEYKGNSQREIAETFGVSENAVLKWKKKEGWLDRKKGLPVVQKVTQELFMAELARQGMDHKKAAELLINGMTKPVKDQIYGPNHTEATPDIVFEGNPDYNTRQKHLHEYLTLAGLIGANGNGLNVNANGSGSVNIQVNLPAKKEDNTNDNSNE